MDYIEEKINERIEQIKKEEYEKELNQRIEAEAHIRYKKQKIDIALENKDLKSLLSFTECKYVDIIDKVLDNKDSASLKLILKHNNGYQYEIKHINIVPKDCHSHIINKYYNDNYIKEVNNKLKEIFEYHLNQTAQYSDNKENLFKDEAEIAYKNRNLEMLSLLDVTGNKYAKEYLIKINDEIEAENFQKKKVAIHNTFRCYYAFVPEGEFGYDNFVKNQNVMRELNVTKDDLSNPKFNNSYSPGWSTPCATVSKGTTQCDITHLLTETQPLRLTNNYYGANHNFHNPYSYNRDPRLLKENGPIAPAWGRE
jgi:hypothetical protein